MLIFIYKESVFVLLLFFKDNRDKQRKEEALDPEDVERECSP